MFRHTFFTLALVLGQMLLGVLCVAPANSIPVKIVNNAGAPIEVFWIDTFGDKGKLVRQTTKPLRNSSDTNINSYKGHQFVAKFLRDVEGAEAFFTKGPTEETVTITYDDESNTMLATHRTKFDEIMDLINGASTDCDSLKDIDFTTCIQGKLFDEVNRLTNTTEEMKRFRDIMAPRIQNYVCADDKANMSEPLRSTKFEDRKIPYTVDLMVDADRAKVWVVKNAISAEECEHLAGHSVPAPATPAVSDAQGSVVTSVDGSSVVDVVRKNGQLIYELPMELPERDKLWPLFSKIFKLTNHAAKLKLPMLPTGQEGFRIARYTEGQGFGPQCSAPCGSHSNATYQEGDRVATAMFFCQAAEEGGILNFPKSDVVLQPEAGMGVFFTYKSPTSNAIDDGYTEHSLCPVRRGQHTVVTAHLRSGVARVTAPAVTAPLAAAGDAKL